MKNFWTKLSLSLLCVMTMSSMALAQFTASGTVTDEKGEPLIAVTVVVKGTTIGTNTDLDGKYKIEVPGSEGTLVFTYIGYASQEIPVSSSNATTNVTLAPSANDLDEVVITGLATTVKRSNLANSVEQVSSKELTGVTVQSTMDAALQGKFKGADIRSNSGAPGGGMSIKLRGVTSIFGDQQPLYIVDGVFINNSTVSLGTNIVSAAAGGGNTATNQDDASNRIADIDPEDIENIEILKGASAAAIYGSRAAGGVVIITTKKGKAGKTRVGLSQVIGNRSAIRLMGMRQWDRQKIEDNFGAADAALFDANGLTDYEELLYGGNALSSTTRLNVSGGNEQTTWFLGGTYKNEDGLVDNTGYEKAAIRLNIGHKFTDWLDVNVTNNYINSTADRGFFNNGNTNTTVGYALAFTRPWFNLQPDADGVYPAVNAVGSNVLETIALTTNRENVNRYIGGVTSNVRLYQSDNQNLKLVLRGGLDQYTLRTTGLFPRALSFYREPGTLGGVAISGSSVSTTRNLAAFLVHSYYTDGGITFRTSGGLTQENFDLNSVITTATGLNGGFQNSLDQSATVSVFQNRVPQEDKGFFVQEEFNFNDKILATVGIRGDKSSNNGDANKLYYYPKANLALNLHEFDFWSVAAISQLKARIAYGQSGRFANFPDRFNALSGAAIAGQSGLITTTLRGNNEVGPERQAETEFGFDIGFLENRITADFTYYIKTIDDLLLRQGVPTSSGFTSKVVNAGALENRGIEIGLNAAVVQSENFNWNTTVNFWRNRSEVTRLDIPAFNLGGFAASLGQYRIQEGKSATQIVGTYIPADCNGCDPENDGMAVYGDAQSDFDMSFVNFMSYGDFELSFLIHWKQGGDGVNLSTLLWDLAGLTWDYDDLTLDPAGQMGNGDYRTSQWFAGNAGPWIEDAGYLRLREIGLFYTLPEEVSDVARFKVGVSGRNLLNFYDYNSYDPEVSNFGGNVLANAIEVTPFPSSKTVNFHLNVNF